MENKKIYELQHELCSYTNKVGENKEFDRYYVVINGIQIELKPADNTARNVLKMFLID